MKKRIVYIISDIDKALAFEWISSELDKTKFELYFLLLNPAGSVLESYLSKEGVPVKRIQCRGKKDWPYAFVQIISYLKALRPDSIHCHLYQACILGLTAAKLLGIPKRIFTRHHGSQHYQNHKKGLLWDRYCNLIATHIVAVSNNVKMILVEWDKAKASKVHIIPHGFKWTDLRKTNIEKLNALRLKYNLSSSIKVIGLISRFIELKGVQYVIPAFKKLLTEYPHAVLLMANAKGDYAPVLKQQLNTLPDSSYRLIEFEKDIATLYKLMDIFIHVPIDRESEAFGQTYVEALAAEVPSIFTLSGIAPDFIVHKENAWVVPFKNTQAIFDGMITLLNENYIRETLKSNGWDSVKECFSVELMVNRLEQLYEN